MPRLTLEEKIKIIDFMRERAVNDFIPMTISNLAKELNKAFNLDLTYANVRNLLIAINFKAKKHCRLRSKYCK